MYAIRDDLVAELDGIREAGLWKSERELTGPQGRPWGRPPGLR